ncbi:MAG: hypothetical protein GY930_02920, partial [bacterium]|nr:hypothetical protein [bacterium]
FELLDVHAGLACSACHGGDLGPSVAELALQAPEDVRACIACHDSPHAQPFAEATPEGCVACHDTQQPGFDHVPEQVVRPVHDRTDFALAGPHKELACDQCHSREGLPNGPAMSGALALSFEQRHPGRSTCVECHADPHGDAFQGGTLAQVIEGRTGCVRCHDGNALKWAPVESFDHVLATGFDLVGVHDGADCTACHKQGDGRRLGALIHPGMGESCSSCHSDPHSVDGRGSVALALRDKAFREQDCHACHNQVDFKEVLDFDHDRCGWPLIGIHERTECIDCHGPGEDVRLAAARKRNVGVKVHCAECHEDPHGKSFDQVAMPQVVEDREGCERCHGQESFRELPGGRFDHGLWTAFDLRGAHRQVRCSECHGVDEKGALKLGEFESLANVDPKAASMACEACHESPHGQCFQTAATPLEIAGKLGCARCHGEQSFRDTPRFKHEFTGYSLEGTHAELGCVLCHGALAPGATPAPRSLARLLPAAGTACADCHSDPHGGQFRSRPDPSCSSCHSDQTSFLLPAFDHTKTRFPLDEVHEPLACSTCHQSAARLGGLEAVRYRPLGIECVDCHGSVLGGSK